MSYVLSGITVSVSPQAVRPREPARPSVKTVTKSAQMAARALRPREAISTPLQTDGVGRLIAKITVFKGQQAALEKVLQALGAELTACAVAKAKSARANSRAGVVAAERCSVRVTSAINACVLAIKACASKANAAAGGAIAKGATRTEVRVAAEIAKPAAGVTVAVESSTASISPSGVIKVGPDAKVITTPTQQSSIIEPGADPAKGGEVVVGPDGEVVLAPADVTVSSGSLGTIALVAGAVGLGYLMLKKRGRV